MLVFGAAAGERLWADGPAGAPTTNAPAIKPPLPVPPPPANLSPPPVVQPAAPALVAPLDDGAWRAARQREAIAAWDCDGDGQLNENEYLQQYIERHRRRFKQLDRNGDGLLSAAELAGAGSVSRRAIDTPARPTEKTPHPTNR